MGIIVRIKAEWIKNDNPDNTVTYNVNEKYLRKK